MSSDLLQCSHLTCVVQFELNLMNSLVRSGSLKLVRVLSTDENHTIAVRLPEKMHLQTDSAVAC